jgi:hypothetical protein
VAFVLLTERLGIRGALAKRGNAYEKLKYLLPPTLLIIDVAVSLSVKADAVRTLSTEHSESRGEHVLVSRVASGHPLIQREHR